MGVIESFLFTVGRRAWARREWTWGKWHQSRLAQGGQSPSSPVLWEEMGGKWGWSPQVPHCLPDDPLHLWWADRYVDLDKRFSSTFSCHRTNHRVKLVETERRQEQRGPPHGMLTTKGSHWPGNWGSPGFWGRLKGLCRSLPVPKRWRPLLGWQ